MEVDSEWGRQGKVRKTRVLGRVNIVKMSQYDLNSNRINKYNAIVWSRDHQESYKQFSSSRIRFEILFSITSECIIKVLCSIE